MSVSTQTLYRATPADLEIRADGRTIAGIAVPYDEPAEVSDRHGRAYTEIFKRGAFAKTITERAQRIKFLVNHDSMNRLPIGAAQVLREDASGLYGEFRVSETREGDEALTLVRDGVLDGLSVGFRPIKDNERRGENLVERIEVALREVSAVAFPAYAGAKVLAVRDDASRLALPSATARLRILQLESQL